MYVCMYRALANDSWSLGEGSRVLRRPPSSGSIGQGSSIQVRPQLNRKDSIIQLLGDIAVESTDPIAGPWESDFGDGVLDGAKLNSLNHLHSGYRSRTFTPDRDSDRQGSWDNFVRGNHDFSKHLSPASPTDHAGQGGGRVGHGGGGVGVTRLQACGQVLQHCSSSCLQQMASRMSAVVAEEGEVIVWEGQQGRGLYFIEQGSLEVTVGGREVRVMVPGECFGEVSLTISEVASAQVKVREKSELLELRARDLWSLFSLFPELYTTLKHQALASVKRASCVDLSGTWLPGPGAGVGAQAADDVSPGRVALMNLLSTMDDPPELAHLEGLLVRHVFAPLEVICQGGGLVLRLPT